MKLESNGILIGLRPLNERDCIARVFTRDFGVLVGMMRGGVVAKKNKPMVGQYGNVTWNARVDSQLGIFHWESEKNIAVRFIMKPGALAMMNAAFDLIGALLPERESYAGLFDDTMRFLGELDEKSDATYLMWEIGLLRELGYALDLSRCSGCGGGNNLNFLSPRTGRAVCDKCAAPYINKLYRLPVTGVVTLKFLENACMQQGIDVPIMRKMLKIA